MPTLRSYMPPSPNVAARRFYRAFYHWAILTWLPASRHHQLHRPNALSFHTSIARRNDAERNTRRLVRRYFAEPAPAPQLDHARQSTHLNTAKGTPPNIDPKFAHRWRHAPVQSLSDRPFQTLDGNAEVVRFRSDSGLLLEYAITGDKLSGAQERYGEFLEQVGTRSGAKVELQNIKRRIYSDGMALPQKTVNSVLISGSFDEVEKAFSMMTGLSSTSLAPQHAHNESVKTRLARTTKINLSKEWRSRPVQSAAEKPANTLAPSEYIVRERSADSIRLDLALEAEHLEFLRIRLGHQLEELSKALRTSVHVYDDSSTVNDASGERAASPIRIVAISGPIQNVQQTWHAIQNDRHMQKLLASPHLSHASRPSHQLFPMEYVIRARTESAITLELSVFDSQWDTISQNKRIAASVAPLRTTTIQVGKGELRPMNATSSDTYLGRSVVISGRLSQVNLVKASLDDVLNGTDQMQARAWLTEPVFSTSSLPSQMLSGGQTVLRHRASSALKVEIVISHDSLIEKQRQFGKAMQLLGLRFGAQIRLLEPFKPSGAAESGRSETSLYPVLLSGTWSQVFRTYECLRERNRPAAEHPVVITQAEVPSSSLTPLDFVVRSIVDGKSTEEMGVLDADWQDFTAAIDLFTMAEETGVSIEAGDLEQRCLSKGSSVMAPSRSISISGPHDLVQSTCKGIRGAIETQERKRRDTIARSMGEENGPSWYSHLRTGSEVAPHPPRDDTASTTALGNDVDPAEAAQLGEDVRVALRTLTHPVVLITSREADAKNSSLHRAELTACRGVTVSSFNTVTLQPQPIISFNLKTPSRTWDAIRTSRNLRVHLLASSGTGAAIADVFTKPYEHAHEGFKRLEDMGVKVLTFQGTIPPRVFVKNGILAEMQATLLFDQCIEVGDHIIAVARVDSCKFTDEDGLKSAAELDSGLLDSMSALSYAKKSYQGAGERVKVAEMTTKGGLNPGKAHSSLDPTDQISPTSSANSSSRSGRARNDNRTPSNTEPTVKTDPIYTALRSTRDAAKQRQTLDIFKLWSEVEEDLSQEAQEEEDDYDFGFDRPQHGTANGQFNTSTEPKQYRLPNESRKDYSTKDPLWSPEDMIREESSRLGNNDRPRAAYNFDGLAAEDGQLSRKPLKAPTSGRRPYSTKFRSGSFPSQHRAFSYTPRAYQKYAGNDHDLGQVVENGALKTTVADFLGVPDSNLPYKSHHVRGILKTNRVAYRAKHTLDMHADRLSDEEKLRLESQIRANERNVTRKLAWNAAGDLRLMLDKGRIDFKRAQFLESVIEKGQALLLDDAKHARQLLEQGKIDLEQFKSLKDRLQNDHATLHTETNRLRQFVDEDEED